MTYRAIFIGGPLDGQERVTQQSVSEIFVNDRNGSFEEIYKYMLLFSYGDNTLVYSIIDTADTLDLVLEYYMEQYNEAEF